ncbi:MAG: F0F1 ATP synthase subunit A [Acidobacteria bacterium]|nr:F0F1 ATP synthase subunit A [Acidobacteriota bacterium]
MLGLATLLATEEGFNANVILSHVGDSAPWIEGAWWSPTKAVLFMVVAALVVFIGVLRAVRGYDADGVPRTRWSQMLDPFVEHFYRDIALPHAGERFAPKVAPLLLNFFFFILTCNLLGLVPISEVMGVALGPLVGHESFLYQKVIEGGSTPTSNFNITATLASITFFAIILFGIAKHGVVGHFAHLAPKGVPFPIRWFLLLPIEIISTLVKPFALTMRLAANMTAGHLGILGLLAIVFILQSVLVGVPVVGLAVAIMLLEIIVAFVQAYVFALLSGVFIGMAIHSH